LVSVLIPCFNAAPWLSNCIDSVLHQQYLKEVIIVDDFSTDESWNIISRYQQQYPKLVKGYKNFNKGGNNARNLAFQLSESAYIQWLDADDVLLPGKLEVQVNYMEQHTGMDIVYSDWELNRFNAAGKLVESEKMIAEDYPDFLLELLKDNWRPPHAYLLRRSAAMQLHNRAWNPKTPAGQDREYFTFAALMGANFGYTPGNYAIYNLKTVKSVSNSLPVQKRAAVMIRLMYAFMDEVETRSWITDDKKDLYKKVLYSQIAYEASYYRIALKGKLPGFSTINWTMLKGNRVKLQVLRNLILKNRPTTGLGS
jgi:glycosyltransferase involved in cell wall biosynthesis